MRKKLISLFFLLSVSFFCSAQTYWNEWIIFSQQYYKIPITQNGIYRLDYSILATAGINVSNIDLRNFQIFYRGQEQYIYVSDKNNNDTLDLVGGDYIEFYGQKNDGVPDSVFYKDDLYDKPARQPNPYYSLFNDTSMYFLTWNNSFNNKRIIYKNDTAYSGMQLSNYFMQQNIVTNFTDYYYGYYTPGGPGVSIDFPKYDEAEGWASPRFSYPATSTQNFNLAGINSASGGNVEIKIALMGESDDPVYPDHHVQINFKNAANTYTTIADVWFDGYALFDTTIYVPASQFGTSTEIVATPLSIPNVNVSSYAEPYVTIKYPHNTNLGGSGMAELLVPDNSQLQQKSFYLFSNFSNPQNDSVYLYDLTNHFRIPATYSSGAYKVLIQNSVFPNPPEKFCVLASEKSFMKPLAIKKVNGTGFFTNFSSLAADSVFLIITHKSLMSEVNNYKAYRASAAGGSHHVLIADIDELYDQFAYGIPKHPFSIRNFSKYCYDKFSAANFSPPNNLFLIGKSVTHEKTRNNNTSIFHPEYQWGNYLANYTSCLVPTMASPPCDNMMLAVLNGKSLAPLIPLGRLAAQTPTDVKTYLTKVQEFEGVNPNPDEWMKHLIHLAGGKYQSQMLQFKSYLQSYEQTINGIYYGGIVHHFEKFTSSQTQTSFTDSIKGLINSGISMITFFGHSSAQVFDFNLLPPDQYDNTNGKYPFFTAAGCVAGDIHEPVSNGATTSEIYVLNQKGMIGVLASSGPGTPGDLDVFCSQLYKNIGYYYYGKPIGTCIQKSIDTIQQSGNDVRTAACFEMTLHGDPSIVIHAQKLADYMVNNSSVYFTPSNVSTDLDSFKMHVIVTNLAKATNDSVNLQVKRIFSDGTFQTYSGKFKHIYYKDTITFTLPVDPIHGPGLNKFEVHVLHNNPELSYSNNDISPPNEILLNIYSGDIIPVYPYKYAIIPNDTVTLKAYTSNPFSNTGTYEFQMDTTDLFNSPVLKTQYVKQNKGAVVKAWFNKWNNQTKFSDSTVYFWRVRRDTSDTKDFRWRESSFQYIPKKSGWGQSHFFQFLKGDQFKYIDTNRAMRSFDLDFRTYSIEIHSMNFSYVPTGESSFFMDGTGMSQYSGLNGTPHVIVSVIDAASGNVWVNNLAQQQWGQAQVDNNLLRYEFYLTTAGQDSLANFILNRIPAGDKVIIYTSDNHNLGDLLGGNPTKTNIALVNAFKSVGGTLFSNIQNNLPYILIGRKNGAAVEAFAKTVYDNLFLSDTMSVKRNSGYIFSEVVGPASKWNSFHWKYKLPNPQTQDSIKISITGIKSNGDTATLFKGITKDSLDFNFNSTIDASVYPTLKLQAWVKDTLKKIPPQLTYWRVYYDGVPEAALNPLKNFSFYKSVIDQGDSLKMSVAIENIGDYAMDSLWVDFWIVDSKRNINLKKSVKTDSLRLGKIVIPSVKFSTQTIPAGLSSLWVEANPFNAKHQLEEYHFNNLGTLPFTVNADKINPVLDVTFDGVHIMNGDIVAAKPSITIKLKDENTFLALNDTGAFHVYLKRPDKSVFEKISFGSAMTFYPAQLPNNSCRINFNPSLADGTYTLKVQAKDRSGNVSGLNEYLISFEVINKPTVTNVLNYPNPFSTSTRFVFTLTGSQVPDYFKIQIMTITGKIVREINKYELGSVHIGRNITDYAWDGKDEFGDQLANGTYIYRIVTQLNGKELEHRETTADSFFNHGYGKMVLIR